MGYTGCVAGLKSSGCAFVKYMAVLEFMLMFQSNAGVSTLT